MKKSPILALLALGALLLPLLAGMVVPAQAQGTTIVKIAPATTTVAVNGTVVVTVAIEGVSNLAGAEVHLSFDPALLEVADADAGTAGVQIAHGNFLSPDFVAQNQVNTTTGMIDYAIAQMPPHAAVNGTGTLANITFKAKAAGTSALTLVTVLLADPNGGNIAVTAQSGSLTITPPATTPAPTTPAPTTPAPTTPAPTTPAPTTPAPTTPAPTSASVSFIPALTQLTKGNRGSFVVRVQAAQLTGVDLTFQFSAGLQVISITPGPCLAATPPVLPASVGGQVRYIASSTTAVAGTCDVATIVVQGIAAGAQSITFPAATVYNGATALATSKAGATVNVVEPTSCTNIQGYHVVRPGETLYAIGRAYATRPDAIAACNGIVNPNRLTAGTRLAIPVAPWSPIPAGPTAPRQFTPGGTVTPTPPPTVTPPPACRYTHVVRPGDTLSLIAWRYGVTVWALASANHIYNLNLIYAGQTLCIP